MAEARRFCSSEASEECLREKILALDPAGRIDGEGTLSGEKGIREISREEFDAVLFDLDGVLTATAKIHAACWKRMFDEFLRDRCQRTGEPFRAFDVESDYKVYVDGKPRVGGVRSFLESRDIHLPPGGPDDSPRRETLHGLGNRKSAMVTEALKSGGVEIYEDAVALARCLRARGVKTGVVSSSSNCRAVLRSAGIEDLFDVRVDGETAARRNLVGKPHPDMFLEASRELDAEPRRTAVVEDAISGVQAGRAGGFGLVVGVSREGPAGRLLEHGADVEVSTLGSIVCRDGE